MVGDRTMPRRMLTVLTIRMDENLALYGVDADFSRRSVNSSMQVFLRAHYSQKVSFEINIYFRFAMTQIRYPNGCREGNCPLNKREIMACEFG